LNEKNLEVLELLKPKPKKSEKKIKVLPIITEKELPAELKPIMEKIQVLKRQETELVELFNETVKKIKLKSQLLEEIAKEKAEISTRVSAALAEQKLQNEQLNQKIDELTANILKLIQLLTSFLEKKEEQQSLEREALTKLINYLNRAGVK
jgi:uncharacterized protein YoxC